MQIESVYSLNFRPYGKIIDGYDLSEFIEVLKQTCPKDSVLYVPSENKLECLPVAQELASRFYGGMPIQIGYCNGRNGVLNCLEYHRDSEINVFASDAILMVALEWEIEGGQLRTNRVKLFHVPVGAAVELYASTLHYAPCSPNSDSFFRFPSSSPGEQTQIGLK